MKSLSSHQNKTYLKFWGIYHFIIIGLFLGLCIFKPSAIKIDADLFNMLPKPVDSKAISAADEKLTEITGQNVFILVSNENFDIAKSVAEELGFKSGDKIIITAGFDAKHGITNTIRIIELK